jgi:hypothetical protein
MYTDISGYAPEIIDSFKKWYYETPENTDPEYEANQFWFNTSANSFGFFGNILKNAYDAKAYYRPNSAIGVYGKLLGGLGMAISLLGLTVDISNTWNANNSNTNGQRLSKTCLQTGVFIL